MARSDYSAVALAGAARLRRVNCAERPVVEGGIRRYCSVWASAPRLRRAHDLGQPGCSRPEVEADTRGWVEASDCSAVGPSAGSESYPDSRRREQAGGPVAAAAVS